MIWFDRIIDQFSVVIINVLVDIRQVLNVMYRQAIEKPYGYIVVDLKQQTQESKRLQTDIFRQYIKDDVTDQSHLFTGSEGVQTSYISINCFVLPGYICLARVLICS